MSLDTRWSLLLILICALCACNKDMDVLEKGELCDKIERLDQDLDLIENYGNVLSFENVNSNERLEFLYQSGTETSIRFDDTVSCTHLTFDIEITGNYLEESGDYIQYKVHQFYSDDFYFDHFIFDQGMRLLDKKIKYNRHVANNINMSFLENEEFILTYINDKGELIAFDDLEGEQWHRESESPDIFFCEVVTNNGNYEASKEFKLFESLATQTLNYNDGFSTSFTFDPYYIDTTIIYSGSIIEDCPEGKLLINQSAELYINYKFGNRYTMDLVFNPTYENAQSDKKYSRNNIFITFNNYSEIVHNINFLDDPNNIYYETNFTPTPYEYHDTLTINQSLFSDVYEFDSDGKALFFNYVHGIIAFEDHLSFMNYLELD